ncbi:MULTISPECIES: type II CRISPR RNA-guided endonuclease Cas9 [unclassified Carboxylicivirga]|uniref:type II CRISPR RNA-guided endonuclease Cas9 n=1 Tax=Carboxylicivirga TaxID=1628153 RepID=UPI003D333840
MSKILGLDLGTNSIGWAIIDATFENSKGKHRVRHYNQIDDCGVRIFPAAVSDIGKGESEKSNNATRTENRQKRRHFYRKRLRKIKLLQVLIDQGMCPLSHEELNTWKNWDRKLKSESKKFPDTDEFKEWIRLNPYKLRSKALTEPISLHELGRIFYHIIQRRGFLSSRKGSDDPKTLFEKGKPDENILPVNATKEKAKKSSLGDYLHSLIPQEGTPYKSITDDNGQCIRARGRYTTRDMYIAEFEAIWNQQAGHLQLDKRNAEFKRTRELKGSPSSKRNQNKLKHLKEIYGSDSVVIGPEKDGHITKVTTKSYIPLKTFLAGNIQEVTLEDGEKTLQFKSNESVLFWQRPLRSQKSFLANCRLEDQLPVINNEGNFVHDKNGKQIKRSKKPCPLSHPEFELFRAYQFINNIRYGKKQALTDEQRHQVLQLINKKDKNFNFSEIPKLLKLTYEKFNYEDDFKVAGNTTFKFLKPLFKAEVWEKHMLDIWHCFYFYEDNDKLYQKLKKDYNCAKSLDIIKKIKLKDGYSNISLKAIRNIQHFLNMGLQFDRAVILGGVKNAFGQRYAHFEESEQELKRDILNILKEENKEGEAIAKIKDYLSNPDNHYGFVKDDPHFFHLYHHSQEVEVKDELVLWVPELENLRNPIVQQALHETRRLVNALLVKYRKELGEDFEFAQIKIEMGRDLRNNKSQREKITKNISTNEAKNNEARERLAEYGLRPSRNNIQKYLMYKEIVDRSGKCSCPYTGKTISMNDLLGRANTIQIEHIIPYSISLEDSFGNKTLCEAHFNNDKGEKTPYEYYTENPDPKIWGANSWDEIAARAFRTLPYPKAKRFTSKKKFEKETFIERQLNDSRYIAKKAVELLSHICHDVRVMPGQLTAELRHLWGLNSILQPTQNIGNHTFELDDDKPVPYLAVTNEAGETVAIHKKFNDRPHTNDDELLLSGYVTKNKFDSKSFKIDFKDLNIKDGHYWAKLQVNSSLKLMPQFTDKPESNEQNIVLRGKVEKGVFKNDTSGNYKTPEIEDGTYWAKFEITNTYFKAPEKNKLPKAKRNQLMLFGTVHNCQFSCYIYNCQTNLPDGKYWLIVDVSPDNIEFIKAINPRPQAHNNEVCISATVDESGFMVADCDPQYKHKTEKQPGKYYATLSIESKPDELHPIEKELPKIEKGQKLIEGSIWVDKYTGEIKFDPKKNRDDHRHHAIDAITIALTEQSYLQRLSTENAKRKDKQRGKENSTEKFPEPWVGFNKDGQEKAAGILVSIKQNNKTLTKNKKGFSVRGQLHKENIFGLRQSPNKEKAFHRRTKVTELKNNKHVAKIADTTIKNIIENFLKAKHGINTDNPKGYSIPKDAFVSNGQWQLLLPNKKGGDNVPIKKVRIREILGNTNHLKGHLNQHVNPRNNHHVLLYKDTKGNLKEEAVQFWTVVERKRQNMPNYMLPEDGAKIVTTIETNDIFLLGLSDDEFHSNRDTYSFLSKNLYRVQKISSMDYTFRHHLASTIANNDEEWRIQSFKAWEEANPIKVKLSPLGKLERLK